MAKANLVFNRIGNDGYKLARRERDGVWFIKEGFYHQSFGWTTTKWAEVPVHSETNSLVETGLKHHADGEKGCVIGFTGSMIFTDGKGLRLPE